MMLPGSESSDVNQWTAPSTDSFRIQLDQVLRDDLLISLVILWRLGVVAFTCHDMVDLIFTAAPPYPAMNSTVLLY